MQNKELKQKIIELLSLQNEDKKIEDQKEYFVIKDINNLDSRKQDLAFLLENYSIRFEKCAFDFLVIEDKELRKSIQFIECKFNETSFQKTKFFQDVSFQESTFANTVDFSDCRFFGEVNFSSTYFKNLDKNSRDFLKFSRSKFKKQADFSNVYFGKDTYFHRCVFYSDLQIYRSRFDAVANFYFATFDNGGIPNFSACVFENPKLANFVGVDLARIQKGDIEKYIQRKAEDEAKQEENKKKNRTEKELKVQHARNIKDSFRVIKDVLLTQNNGLEAQVWHKIELYAKEIEIEFLIEEEQQSKKQSYKKLGLMLDKNILHFYRLISDHHNNFSKILNITIYVIVFHSVFIWLFQYLLSTNFFSSTQLVETVGRLMTTPLFLIAFFIVLALAFNFVKRRFLSSLALKTTLYMCLSCATIILLIVIARSKLLSSLYVLYVFVFAIVCLYCFLFFIMLPLLRFIFFRVWMCTLLTCLFIFNPNILNPFIGIFKENSLTNVIIKDYIDQSDLEKIRVMFSECDWASKRFEHDLEEYSSLKNTLVLNARLILDMCSRRETKKENDVKSEDKSSNELDLFLIKNEIFNLVSNSINVIYLIMLILLLFSLQKTARKNSIIPS